MKNYLDLVKICYKANKQKNRMTVFSITIAVLLVTAIFSMIDNVIIMEKNFAIKEYGNYHITVSDVDDQKYEEMKSDKDVDLIARYNVLNYHLDDSIKINNSNSCVIFSDEELFSMMDNLITQGNYPTKEDEALVSQNIEISSNIQVGDKITVKGEEGEQDFIVSGFCNLSSLNIDDGLCVILNEAGWKKYKGNYSIKNLVFIKFKNERNIRVEIARLKENYNLWDDEIKENIYLLSALGASDNNYITDFYELAVCVFIIILIAASFMISGTMNFSVSERIKFFGTIQCLGADKTQIIRYVRREALYLCKIAVPMGIVLGITSSWIICIVLKLVKIENYFGEVKLWNVSPNAAIAGIAIGVLSVLVASNAPAKIAAKISPIEATSGSFSDVVSRCRKVGENVDISLGIKHSFENKKRLITLIGSFCLSIVLYLTITVLIDLAGNGAKNLRPYAPDISIYDNNSACIIDKNIIDEIKNISGVKKVYGRMFCDSLSGECNGIIRNINLISYDEMQYDWARKYINDGNLEPESNDKVAIVYDSNNLYHTGDYINIAGHKYEISTELSESPFTSRGEVIIICNEQVFKNITGIDSYAVVDIQVNEDITKEDVKALKKLAGDDLVFSDRRTINSDAKAMFLVSRIITYGFVGLIGFITVFHIINSVSMSIISKKKMIGMMRAIGMEDNQVKNMISAEVLSYVMLGSISGMVLGITANSYCYKKLITSYWGTEWHCPIVRIMIIITLVIVSALIAANRGAKIVLKENIIESTKYL